MPANTGRPASSWIAVPPERGTSPGYHQWPWDGRDADGDILGNGVYIYRMIATTGDRSDRFDGRLVKLRKPRRGDVITP